MGIRMSRHEAVVTAVLYLKDGRKVQAAKLLREVSRFRTLRDAVEMVRFIESQPTFNVSKLAEAALDEMDRHVTVWLGRVEF